MTSAEFAQLLAAGGLFFGFAALVFIFYLNRVLKGVQRNQRVILGNRGETDILGHIADLDGQVDNLRMALEDLAVTAKDHEVRIDGCLARTGLVRFDAYEDLGGRQSTAICFLDQNQNGVVITTVVSREFARMYVKGIKDGQADVPLAPEETEAFDMARAQGPPPFTVRPRLEKLREDRGMAYETPEEAVEEDVDEDTEAALRALERENRRRMRRGLPPLDALPPVPSTLGWGPAAGADGLPEAQAAEPGQEGDEERISPDQMRLDDRGGDARAPGGDPARATAAPEGGAPAGGDAPDRTPDADEANAAPAPEDTIEFEWEPVPSPRRRARRDTENGRGEG